MSKTGKRIIGDKDGYNIIYNQVKNTRQLIYFRKWNNREIKSRDIEEDKIFTDLDIKYIKELG